MNQAWMYAHILGSVELYHDATLFDSLTNCVPQQVKVSIMPLRTTFLVVGVAGAKLLSWSCQQRSSISLILGDGFSFDILGFNHSIPKVYELSYLGLACCDHISIMKRL